MKTNRYKSNQKECFEKYMRECKRCHKLYYSPCQNSDICPKCSKSNKEPKKLNHDGN